MNKHIPSRPEPKPLGSIYDDPNGDLPNYFVTMALALIFILVLILLITAIATMGELLELIKMTKLEGGL